MLRAKIQAGTQPGAMALLHWLMYHGACKTDPNSRSKFTNVHVEPSYFSRIHGMLQMLCPVLSVRLNTTPSGLSSHKLYIQHRDPYGGVTRQMLQHRTIMHLSPIQQCEQAQGPDKRCCSDLYEHVQAQILSWRGAGVSGKGRGGGVAARGDGSRFGCRQAGIPRPLGHAAALLAHLCRPWDSPQG